MYMYILKNLNLEKFFFKINNEIVYFIVNLYRNGYCLQMMGDFVNQIGI